MKRMILALFALFLPTVALADTPSWSPSFEQACRDAEASHKIVLVDVYTTWCGPCHALDERTWPNPDVQKWIVEKAVAVKVDAEKLTDLAAKYRITAYPTILLLRPDGTEIDRIVGYREPAALIAEASDSLAGKDSVARAKAKLAGPGANDPSARMDYARALAQKSRSEEALAEYLWCYDHGLEHDPFFIGVRLSFLLSEIASLGKSFPPATAALELRRDAAEKEVLGGSASLDSVLAFSSIDRVLEDEARTLAAYDALKTKSPKTRAMLFTAVVDGLLQAKRYGDVAEGSGDLTKNVEVQIENFEGMKPSIANMPDGEHLVAEFRQNAVESAAKYYETLVALGRLDEGTKAVDTLIAFAPTGETYATLIRAATRAGKSDVARALVTRGLAALPEAEYGPLREAAGEIAGAASKSK